MKTMNDHNSLLCKKFYLSDFSLNEFCRRNHVSKDRITAALKKLQELDIHYDWEARRRRIERKAWKQAIITKQELLEVEQISPEEAGEGEVHQSIAEWIKVNVAKEPTRETIFRGTYKNLEKDLVKVLESYGIKL